VVLGGSTETAQRTLNEENVGEPGLRFRVKRAAGPAEQTDLKVTIRGWSKPAPYQDVDVDVGNDEWEEPGRLKP